MILPDLHARLLADVLALGAPYPLVLTGGYAVQAHALLSRPSQDLDVATENPAPMGEIATRIADGLAARGWQVDVIEIAPLSARLYAVDAATEQATGEGCELDILKEIFWRPAAECAYGPVLSEQDVIGTKVRALAERGLARDALDVYAASQRWTRADLEEFGRRHARDSFGLRELQERLVGVDWIDDAEFEAYGTQPEVTGALRVWAQEWADELAERILEEDSAGPGEWADGD